jgi:hypothetical protein
VCEKAAAVAAPGIDFVGGTRFYRSRPVFRISEQAQILNSQTFRSMIVGALTSR